MTGGVLEWLHCFPRPECSILPACRRFGGMSYIRRVKGEEESPKVTQVALTEIGGYWDELEFG
jgi:hypothetical protein